MENDTYSILREFADSWFLLFMFAFFIGAVLWLFRPGSRPVYDNASTVPFRHEDAPASSDAEPREDRS